MDFYKTLLNNWLFGKWISKCVPRARTATLHLISLVSLVQTGSIKISYQEHISQSFTYNEKILLLIEMQSVDTLKSRPAAPTVRVLQLFGKVQIYPDEEPRQNAQFIWL